MDPISAVGIAAASVAFLDFSVKTLIVCKKLRDSTSALPENLDIERRAKTLQRLTKDLTLPCSSSNPTDKRIRDLGLKCASLAEELQKLLDKIKPHGTSFSNQLKSALRSVKEARTIERLETQISAYREILDTSLLLSVRQRLNTLDFQNSKEFEKLQKSSRDVIKRLANIEDINREEHQDTRSQIAMHIKESQSIVSAQVAKENLDTRAIVQASIDVSARKEQNDAILKNLVFPEYKARQEQIHEAHRKTFRWIFDRGTKALGKWDNFAEWLRCGDDIFWIQGKPGSGKSTLMSFILEESQTMEELACWADGQTLASLSFFFWRPGTPLQKSRVGMLRSLLYQLLEADEDIIPQLFASDPNILVWTDRAALKKFLKALALTKHKVCIFLDGLDEFEGDVQSTEMILDLCTECANLPNVKLCVSSRPEIPLKRRLELFKQLQLQDLNRRDMENFVLERLEDPSLELLRKKVVSKAEGIFLWTSLVTNSLREGYLNHDNEQTLLLRLNSFPSGLEALYSRMLEDISPFYKKIAAAYLLMAHLSRRDDNPMPELTVLTLTVTMDETLANYSSEHIFGSFTAEEVVSQCQVTIERVQIYCRGLLEITDSTSDYGSDSDPEGANEILDATRELLMEDYDFMVIGFTHRTAYDFIFDSAAGHNFVQMSLYSEGELEIRLVSSLLGQILLLPNHTKLGIIWDGRRTSRLLSRPIVAASLAQHLHSLRDSLLDKFYDRVCCSDEDSFGADLMNYFNNLSAGDSSNGFLACCMELSSCYLAPYVASRLRLQNDQNISPSLLSNATFLCHLTQYANRFPERRSTFAQGLKVPDLLLCRLEKEISKLCPKKMEQYRSDWHRLPGQFAVDYLMLGNLDYAKIGEDNSKILNLAQTLSLIANSRAYCIAGAMEVLNDSKRNDFDDEIGGLSHLIERLGMLVPDGHAWSLMLYTDGEGRDLENKKDVKFYIYMPVGSLAHDLLGNHRIGWKTRFDNANERYIFWTPNSLMLLSAEESMELENLLVAESRMQRSNSRLNYRAVKLPSTVASRILGVCPSIQKLPEVAALPHKIAGEGSKMFLSLRDRSLNLKVQKQQQTEPHCLES